MTHVFPSPGLKATLSPSDGEGQGEGVFGDLADRTRYEDAPARRQPPNRRGRNTSNREMAITKIMKTAWFKKRGWFYQPVSWQGVAMAAAALLFCVQVFCAVDRKSHSVSDTLYGVFPFFVCAFLLLDWIATRTSRESN